MQGNNPYSNVLSSVRSSDDVNQLLDELSTLKNSLYQTKGNTFEEVLKTRVRKKTAVEIEKLVSQISDKAVVLAELEKQIAGLKTLDLTLGFEPSESTIEKLYEWVTTQMGEGIVLKISFDPGIIGGVLISFNGKYADESLKKIIDKHIGVYKAENLHLT